MNRPKKLCVLLGILAAACVAAFAVMHAEERREQIKNSGETILALAGQEVQSLSWDYENTSLAFHRDGTWLYDGDETFPVSQERILPLFSGVVSLPPRRRSWRSIPFGRSFSCQSKKETGT